MKHFTELPLSEHLQHQLKAGGFVTPTPVQALAIPPGLEGRDVLATAQTGTGKTLAFLIPIVEQLLAQPKDSGVHALVLVPTRELALQVHEQYTKLRGKRLPAAAVVMGGVAEQSQLKALKGGARVVIATPGRLEDYLDRSLVDLRRTQVLVLDEFDRMLDMGFIPAVRRIVSLLPRERQTLCFSATLPPTVTHLLHEYQRQPLRVAVGPVQGPSDRVTLQVYEVSTAQKLGLLQHLLEKDDGTFLVFTRTKHGAERLTRKLQRQGLPAAMIHGDRSQSQRNAALNGFKEGKHRILVATDVMARGIHVDDIAHVVNFDLPKAAEDFVHRIGRTGRVEGWGVASTFMTPSENADLRVIERTLKVKMERMTVEGEIAAEFQPGPVDLSALPPAEMVGSRNRMRLPGEKLQRLGDTVENG